MRFAIAHDREGRFRFAPLQGGFAREALGRHARDPDDLNTVFVIARHGEAEERLLSRSDAILFLLGELGWPRLAAIARRLPAFLRDRAYDLFAANRYRLFGRFAACRVPTSAERARFIEPGPPA